MTKFAAALLLTVPAIAFAATYSVTEQPSATSGAKLVSLGTSGCAYAGVPLALGDILNYSDGSRQVCASGDHGPQLIFVVPAKPAKAGA